MRYSLLATLILAPALAFGQGQVNTPAQDSVQSGSNVIEGFHCDAGMASEIYGIIDGSTRVDMLFPYERRATETTCGHAMTGFMVQYFWTRLEPGPHTLDMVIDGELFDSVDFTTERLGNGFITPPQPDPVQVADFPGPGQTTWLCWSESLQDFGVCDVKTGAQETNRSRTERLIGSWLMRYTIIVDWTDEYTCRGPARPNPNEAGSWVVDCTDKFGLDSAIGAWVVAEQAWAIGRTGTIIDQLYGFDLDANDNLAGCYWQYSYSTDRWSRCYDLTGRRLATKSAVNGGDPLDAEWQRELEASDKAESDPRAVELYELLAQ